MLGQSAELGLAASSGGARAARRGRRVGGARRAELLRLEPELEFAHPVVRAAIYETIGPVERADAHRRAAGLLADAGAEPEQGGVASAPRAAGGRPVRGCGRCAPPPTRALGRGATHEAAVYLRRALAEPPPAE